MAKARGIKQELVKINDIPEPDAFDPPTPLDPAGEDEDLDTPPEAIPPTASRTSLPAQGPGRMGNDHKALLEFDKHPRSKQRELVEQEWAKISYTLALRAKRVAKGALMKDFQKVQQIVTSAAIAKDKAYPSKDTAPSQNVIFNLFGNMGVDALQRVLRPPMLRSPEAIDITPKESLNA